MIEIHPVDRAYSAVLSALHCECLDEGWGPSAMADVMRSPGVYALMAFDGEAPVGFALGRLAGDAAELLSLGVLAPYRRRFDDVGGTHDAWLTGNTCELVCRYLHEPSKCVKTTGFLWQSR